ncbi:MAG: hypothetical protein ACXWV1_08325, partial [Chitinophagaceae bacterium]
MKRRVLIFIHFTLFCCFQAWSQSASLTSKAITVKRMVELKHVDPRLVDDSFSVAMFRSMLKAMDRRKLLITESEYKNLLAFSTKL